MATLDTVPLHHSTHLGGYLLFYREGDELYCPHDVYVYVAKHKPAAGYFINTARETIERENYHLAEAAEPVPFCIYPGDREEYAVIFLGEGVDEQTRGQLCKFSLSSLYRNTRCPYYFIGRMENLIKSCLPTREQSVGVRLDGGSDREYAEAGWNHWGNIFSPAGVRIKMFIEHRCTWWRRRRSYFI